MGLDRYKKRSTKTREALEQLLAIVEFEQCLRDQSVPVLDRIDQIEAAFADDVIGVTLYIELKRQLREWHRREPFVLTAAHIQQIKSFVDRFPELKPESATILRLAAPTES